MTSGLHSLQAPAAPPRLRKPARPASGTLLPSKRGAETGRAAPPLGLRWGLGLGWAEPRLRRVDERGAEPKFGPAAPYPVTAPLFAGRASCANLPSTPLR